MRRLNKTELAKSYVPDDDAPADAFDWKDAKAVTFPNVKPSSTTVSLHIPVWMLHELKRMANVRDVPYQSLIKMILAERLQKNKKARRVTSAL
jgi:predicted DNA binding CopG/RHH family protein